MADNIAHDLEFTEREQHILKLLIAHYIDEGQPVGSRTISRLPDIDISAASVRNVMGDLPIRKRSKKLEVCWIRR